MLKRRRIEDKDKDNINVITYDILEYIIKSNTNLIITKVTILNLFYFHTHFKYIQLKALKILLEINDLDINNAVQSFMYNITPLLTIIIENNNFIFFISCINDKTKIYNRMTLICTLAMINFEWLNIFDSTHILSLNIQIKLSCLTPEEIVIIIRIGLVPHTNTEILKSFIIKYMNKLVPQKILEIAIDYNNKDIALFMLPYCEITLRILYLSVPYKELFKILYEKINKNILKAKKTHTIIESLELNKIIKYKEELCI